jgi:hypothetical protein
MYQNKYNKIKHTPESFSDLTLSSLDVCASKINKHHIHNRSGKA